MQVVFDIGNCIRDLNEKFNGSTVYRCGDRAVGNKRERLELRDSQRQKQFPAPGLNDWESASLAKDAAAGAVAIDTDTWPQHRPGKEEE